MYIDIDTKNWIIDLTKLKSKVQNIYVRITRFLSDSDVIVSYCKFCFLHPPSKCKIYTMTILHPMFQTAVFRSHIIRAYFSLVFKDRKEGMGAFIYKVYIYLPHWSPIRSLQFTVSNNRLEIKETARVISPLTREHLMVIGHPLR